MENYQTIDWDKTPTFKVELNWQAYYEKFKEKHGYPILYKGRLLFPDGWTYSATDYAGPEWCPPESPSVIADLRLDYWRIRLAMVMDEHGVLKRRLENLQRIQKDHDVQLQQRTVHYNEEKKRRVAEISDLDLATFQGRFDWLSADIQECNEHIEEIKEQMK